MQCYSDLKPLWIQADNVMIILTLKNIKFHKTTTSESFPDPYRRLDIQEDVDVRLLILTCANCRSGATLTIIR